MESSRGEKVELLDPTLKSLFNSTDKFTFQEKWIHVLSGGKKKRDV